MCRGRIVPFFPRLVSGDIEMSIIIIIVIAVQIKEPDDLVLRVVIV